MYAHSGSPGRDKFPYHNKLPSEKYFHKAQNFYKLFKICKIQLQKHPIPNQAGIQTVNSSLYILAACEREFK